MLQLYQLLDELLSILTETPVIDSAQQAHKLIEDLVTRCDNISKFLSFKRGPNKILGNVMLIKEQMRSLFVIHIGNLSVDD